MIRWSPRSSSLRLAHTLHEMRVLTDEMFDQLIIGIYEKYGDESYVRTISNHDPLRVGKGINSSCAISSDVNDTVGLPLDREKGQE